MNISKRKLLEVPEIAFSIVLVRGWYNLWLKQKTVFVLRGHHPPLPLAIRKVSRAISIPDNALIHQFMEYYELEGTHRDHRVQSFLQLYSHAALFVQSVSLQMNISNWENEGRISWVISWPTRIQIIWSSLSQSGCQYFMAVRAGQWGRTKEQTCWKN